MGRAFEYRRAAKEKRWDKMSKVFPKLAKAITLAAKEGGMDPEMNAKLRTAIQNAKGENMPKDNIENAIKRAEAKDAENYVEVNYDVQELELELIDAGLEEIEVDGTTAYAYADWTDFGTLSQALEDQKIEVTKSNLQRFPTTPVEFTDEQMVDIEKMMDKIEDDDDTQAVYTNIA